MAHNKHLKSYCGRLEDRCDILDLHEVFTLQDKEQIHNVPTASKGL